MRNLFLAMLFTSALFACNDNVDKSNEATTDSLAIETPVDSSNTTIQADTAAKAKPDTTAAPVKAAKKKK